MKKTVLLLLLSLGVLFSGCSMLTFAPKIGMGEKRWLYSTTASDLVYIEGNVKAYRSSGTYYYFKDGKLAKVTPSLLTADQI